MTVPSFADLTIPTKVPLCTLYVCIFIIKKASIGYVTCEHIINTKLKYNNI